MTFWQEIICNIPNVASGNRWYALSGYDYLKMIDQPCAIDGGPRKCVVLFCFDGTTIWLCNDNEQRISYSCAYLADYVLDLIGDLDCSDADGSPTPHWTEMQGQVI